MDTSLTYNGVNLGGQDVPYLLSEIEGLVGTPVLDKSRSPRLGRHGVIRHSTYRRERIVTFEVHVVAFDEASFADAVADLSAAFGDTEVHTLAVTMPGVARGNAVQLQCDVENFALPQTESYAEWAATAVVELCAVDARYRSAVQHLITIGVAATATGRTYPRTYPWTYPTAGQSGLGSATNAGDVPAELTLRIFGPVVDPVVRNETTDEELSFDIDLAQGDYLDINSEARTVVINGQASRYSSLVSADFFQLAPGVNSIRYTAPVPTASYLELRWEDMWL